MFSVLSLQLGPIVSMREVIYLHCRWNILFSHDMDIK